MADHQPGILGHVPNDARYLTFTVRASADPHAALTQLARMADGEAIVVGIGHGLALTLGAAIPGLIAAPTYAPPLATVPSTPGDLWCWLRGGNRGSLLHRSRALTAQLAGAFQLRQSIEGFKHGTGLDLTGYEDGTENPKAAKALEAAITAGAGAGLDGGSYVAVQQWLHDFAAFDALTPEQRDAAIGRRISDNEELGDAPESAHVKRTAQESFSPEAFLYRRSMPWISGEHAGLMFVAFGRSFAAFAAQLQRMVGAEDGVADAIFGFTQPVTGAYYWCPPLRQGRLDLSRLGI